MMIPQVSFETLVVLGVMVLGFAATGAVSLFGAHKARRAYSTALAIRDEVSLIGTKHLINLSQNLQALQALQYELEMARPLPPMRGWAASPDVLLVLARHARTSRAQTIVECGSGVSTVVLARCCQLLGSGHVHSLDHDAGFAEKTRAMLDDHGLSSWATVHDAPLRPHRINGEDWMWYDLGSLPADLSIDLLFVDGPPEPIAPLIRYPAGPVLMPRLNRGGVVFVDDAARAGEREMLDRWARLFPTFSRHDHVTEKGCSSMQAAP